MKFRVFEKKLASQPGKKYTSEEFRGHCNVPVLYCVPLDHMYVLYTDMNTQKQLMSHLKEVR